MTYSPAEVPTMAFIGVSTAESSINRVFPLWAEALGLEGAALVGYDFVPHDDPERYREMVSFIREDPMTLGALVTTHKLDLYTAASDHFDVIDPLAETMGEISSISKDGEQLVGHAKDPITSGLALDAFLPEAHWQRTGAEALVIRSLMVPSGMPYASDSGMNHPAPSPRMKRPSEM